MKARFSTADKGIFQQELKKVEKIKVSREKFTQFMEDQIDLYKRLQKKEDEKLQKAFPHVKIQPTEDHNLSSYKRIRGTEDEAFMWIPNPNCIEKEKVTPVGWAANKAVDHDETLNKIKDLFEVEPKDAPVNDNTPYFVNGKFRKNWIKSIEYSTDGQNFDRIFKERVEQKYREKLKKKENEPKIKVQKPKKKKFRPIKAIKKWYETYLKPEKKPEKEKPWFPLEEANRLRVLAGIPPVEPEIEPPKRSRWWKFRVFMFRQLSLIIWRIHPESKVETKSYVVLPDMSTHRNMTEDLEFLIRHS